MSSVQTIEVHTAPAYEVTIGAGLLRECGARLKTVLGGCRIAVAADSNVAPLYLETVCASLRDAGFAVCSYVFPAGRRIRISRRSPPFWSFWPSLSSRARTAWRRSAAA